MSEMPVRRTKDIPASEITEEQVYLSRRLIMRGAVLGGTTLATGWLYRQLNYPPAPRVPLATLAGVVTPTTVPASAGFTTNEARTSLEDITHYNNFYEFSTDKSGVAYAARGFVTKPWTISVTGLCGKPAEFDLEDLARLFPPEERVYRMRCVEGWSMVIPWDGFSLSKLLDRVEPTSQAKYVAFQTLFDPKRMPNQDRGFLNWPYVEGLRMDEAMHPLAILATGIYGKALPPQDGAPIRLVVPWKYGFKGIKSIVKIRFVDSPPKTTWNEDAPYEYGFYANVNPSVDHPRWSQARERRIGEGKRDTLMFNGYADQVASLYAGMDLRGNF